MFKVGWVVEVGDVDARSCRGMASLRCWKLVDEDHWWSSGSWWLFFTRIVDQSLSDYILIGLCATGNYRHKSNRDIDDPTLEIVDFYKVCLTRLLYDVVNDIDADDDVIDCDKVWSTYLSTLSTFPTTGLSARDSWNMGRVSERINEIIVNTIFTTIIIISSCRKSAYIWISSPSSSSSSKTRQTKQWEILSEVWKSNLEIWSHLWEMCFAESKRFPTGYPSHLSHSLALHWFIPTKTTLSPSEDSLDYL